MLQLTFQGRVWATHTETQVCSTLSCSHIPIFSGTRPPLTTVKHQVRQSVFQCFQVFICGNTEAGSERLAVDHLCVNNQQTTSPLKKIWMFRRMRFGQYQLHWCAGNSLMLLQNDTPRPINKPNPSCPQASPLLVFQTILQWVPRTLGLYQECNMNQFQVFYIKLLLPMLHSIFDTESQYKVLFVISRIAWLLLVFFSSSALTVLIAHC